MASRRKRATHGADDGREATARDRPRRCDGACRAECCGGSDSRQHSGNHCAGTRFAETNAQMSLESQLQRSRAGLQLVYLHPEP